MAAHVRTLQGPFFLQGCGAAPYPYDVSLAGFKSQDLEHPFFGDHLPLILDTVPYANGQVSPLQRLFVALLSLIPQGYIAWKLPYWLFCILVVMASGSTCKKMVIVTDF